MAEIVSAAPLGAAKIVYRVRSIAGDGVDSDDIPDLGGVSGTWKLTPIVNRVLVTASSGPYTLVPLPISGSFVNGVLEYNGLPYVKVPTSPRGAQDRPYFLWRMEATYRLTSTASVADNFQFDARPTDIDADLDLTLVRPVDTVAGTVPVTMGPAGASVDGAFINEQGQIVFTAGQTDLDPLAIDSIFDDTFIRAAQARIGIDTDGTPYFDPTGFAASSVPVLADDDGVPYIQMGG